MAINELDLITVRVLKHDDTEHRRWRARVSRQEGPLIVLDAEFDFDVEHDLLGQIRSGTRTIEYYWLGRWYNVFRFLEGGGTTRLFYCNINMPPTLEGDVLTYIDLDIDVLVQPDLSYKVLDLEEFAVNFERYGYSEEIKGQAHATVDELIFMIETRQFPFEQRVS